MEAKNGEGESRQARRSPARRDLCNKVNRFIVPADGASRNSTAAPPRYIRRPPQAIRPAMAPAR